MKTWTKTPSSKTGWYWARYREIDDPEVVKVTQRLWNGELHAWATGLFGEELSIFYEWYPEPIQCPGLKEDE
jgi:hypothetical protein